VTETCPSQGDGALGGAEAADIADLASRLAGLHRTLTEAEDSRADAITRVPAARRGSAINLIHYLALRSRDERELQFRLTEYGLSSLGRCEAHVAATVEAVQRALALMRARPTPAPQAPLGVQDGGALLSRRADELLGASRHDPATRILVTLPSEAATDASLVQAMVNAGMDCARINTAHDDPVAWEHMAANVRRAASTAGRPCRILIDLAGPKLRTGAIEAGKGGRERIPVERGDRLIVTADQSPGYRARRASPDRPARLARVPCSLPEALAFARVGDPVWFDDGRVGAVVEEASASEVVVRITHARAKGDRIRPQKGINMPETAIDVPALGPDDLAALPVVAKHADLVGLSFAQSPHDVIDLRRRLEELDAGHIGTVLKIETALGFEVLPELLLAGLEGGPLGVMIARGDLAVEIGYARLAEVQEEILWLCEAAHVPTIWATEVLDTLAREGRPSRAEITDAAAGVRAECVMLNKGPEIVATIEALDDILERMASHHDKKTSLLRELRSWRSAEPEANGA